MSAKVTILSDRQEDVLQIPLTAVIRKEGQSFCIVRKAEELIELATHPNWNPQPDPFLLGGISEGDKWW